MKSQTDLLAVGILLAALFNRSGQNGSSESPGSVDASFNPSPGTTLGGQEIALANFGLGLWFGEQLPFSANRFYRAPTK